MVTDGGYLADFTVSGGEISLGDGEASIAYVGYSYLGFIKTFSLGFVAEGRNTQATMKALYRAGIRCVASAGGKFGTDLYDLEPVQELDEGNLNYLPPLILDGTKFVDISDDHAEDKYAYFVQDLPLPFTLTAMMIEGSYTGG